jgi:translation initiation factor IF-1
MADRRSLGIVGFMLGGVTLAVMLTAAVVVKSHLDGRMTLEARNPVLAASVQTVIR